MRDWISLSWRWGSGVDHPPSSKNLTVFSASDLLTLSLCLLGTMASDYLLSGVCVGSGPQWDPLILEGTLGLTSHFDFWKGLCNLLSVSQVHRLSTKCTLGLITMQKAFMCLSLLLDFSALNALYC